MDKTEGLIDGPSDFKAALEPRFYAAMIDMFLIAAACFTTFAAQSVLFPAGPRWFFVPEISILAILCLMEAATGRSAGKRAMHIRVESSSGGPATILQTSARAFLRWSAPLLAESSLLARSVPPATALAGLSVVLVICEIPVCYITLFRRGGTLFDLMTATQVRGG